MTSELAKFLRMPRKGVDLKPPFLGQNQEPPTRSTGRPEYRDPHPCAHLFSIHVQSDLGENCR